MKSLTKSEWFEFDYPIGEPDHVSRKEYNANNKYRIERIVNQEGEVIWFGINVNWKKMPGEEWTVLSINQEAKPLEKYLPEIVYGEDRVCWKLCDIPIYEQMYLRNNGSYAMLCDWERHIEDLSLFWKEVKKIIKKK